VRPPLEGAKPPAGLGTPSRAAISPVCGVITTRPPWRSGSTISASRKSCVSFSTHKLGPATTPSVCVTKPRHAKSGRSRWKARVRLVDRCAYASERRCCPSQRLASLRRNSTSWRKKFEDGSQCRARAGLARAAGAFACLADCASIACDVGWRAERFPPRMVMGSS